MTPMQARAESRRWRPVLRMIDEIMGGDVPAHTGSALAYVHGMAGQSRFSPRVPGKSVAPRLSARPSHPHSPGSHPNPPPGDQRPVYSPRAGLWNLKGDQ